MCQCVCAVVYTDLFVVLCLIRVDEHLPLNSLLEKYLHPTESDPVIRHRYLLVYMHIHYFDLFGHFLSWFHLFYCIPESDPVTLLILYVSIT